jgi:hypothetical protein
MRDVLFPKKRATRTSNGNEATDSMAKSAPSHQAELTPLCGTI